MWLDQWLVRTATAAHTEAAQGACRRSRGFQPLRAYQLELFIAELIVGLVNVLLLGEGRAAYALTLLRRVGDLHRVGLERRRDFGLIRVDEADLGGRIPPEEVAGEDSRL